MFPPPSSVSLALTISLSSRLLHGTDYHSLTHFITCFLSLSVLVLVPPLPSFTISTEKSTRHKAESLKWSPGVAAVPSPPHVKSYLILFGPRVGPYITSVRAANLIHTHLTKPLFSGFIRTSTPETPQHGDYCTKPHLVRPLTTF